MKPLLLAFALAGLASLSGAAVAKNATNLPSAATNMPAQLMLAEGDNNPVASHESHDHDTIKKDDEDHDALNNTDEDNNSADTSDHDHKNHEKTDKEDYDD